MAELIESPVRVEGAGQPPKTIEEFTGRASTGETRASIARMRSPVGWAEPGQRPEFDEYTVVLDGSLHVETDSGTLEVSASQAVQVRAGEWVRYSTPQGAEYISFCLPAFSPETVHRDARRPLRPRRERSRGRRGMDPDDQRKRTLAVLVLDETAEKVGWATPPNNSEAF
jgi:mannose-6-phosphate isomerase-like protein (cupin superfamily)